MTRDVDDDEHLHDRRIDALYEKNEQCVMQPPIGNAICVRVETSLEWAQQSVTLTRPHRRALGSRLDANEGGSSSHSSPNGGLHLRLRRGILGGWELDGRLGPRGDLLKELARRLVGIAAVVLETGRQLLHDEVEVAVELWERAHLELGAVAQREDQVATGAAEATQPLGVRYLLPSHLQHKHARAHHGCHFLQWERKKRNKEKGSVKEL
eukprot:6048445-Pleurochrysis_carterae.AAC.2